MNADGRRGVTVYIVAVLAGVSLVAWLMHALQLSVSDGAGVPFVLMAMWAPALARVIETLFHVPMILLAGYVASDRPFTGMALFFGLGLGLTPVWTWATYRWNSLWIAVWFHTFHNALSQTILPKALGAGGPLVLGES